jgi:acyl-CoA synthetase (AMP-forming)/AMP-acid ligase II
MNVFETLSRAARQWPERPAIIDGARTLNYQSLWREVEAMRIQLGRLGVRDRQGVGILTRNGPAFIIGALAALGCDAVVMPIHHQLKSNELVEMLDRAPVAAIIEDGSCRHQLDGACHKLELLDRTSLRFIRLTRHAPAPLAPWVEDAAFVRFTSGTTSLAKGVILTHQGVLERTRAANAGLGLGCEDKVLWVLPMAYHLFVSIMLYLEVGASIIVCSDHLAESILVEATQHQVTFLYAAPMHVRMLAADVSGRKLPPTLRRVMSVSSHLHPQAAKVFLSRYGVPVAQGYGIIEVGLPIMNFDDAVEHPGAIGRPLPAFDAAILDEGMKPVADGETGQLALRGPGMFAGYLSPRMARDEVLCGGWFMTGDLAHRDGRNLITIDGRRKSVINVAGHKVFPEDVAAVLDQHPAVLRSRVTMRPHAKWGEVVHAEVQLRESGVKIAAEDLMGFCRHRLSSYKVPDSIDFVAEIELTPSGKVRHG